MAVSAGIPPMDALLKALGPQAKDVDEVNIEYIVGVLQVVEENEGAAELCETIGLFLPGDEEWKMEACDTMLTLLRGRESKSSARRGHQQLLNAPINLGGAADGNDVEGSGKKGRQPGWQIPVDELFAKKEKKEKKAGKKKDKVSNPASVPTTFIKKHKAANADSGNTHSLDLHLDNFNISVGGKTLLQDTSLMLAYGRRYGLVGRNGSGKTTLLRQISMRELQIPPHLDILHVEQEVIGDDTLALQSVLEADVEREALVREEKRILAEFAALAPAPTPADGTTPAPATTPATTPATPETKPEKTSGNAEIDARLSEIYKQMAAIEADKAPAVAGSILAGLGFSPQMQARPTREFSGGWRMRIALARALFCRPDVLLLDEPTNMLDVRAVLWLERYLSRGFTAAGSGAASPTLLVVSHDREFLNSVCTDMVHLHTRKLTAYRGNYDAFEEARSARLKNQVRLREAQEFQRKQVQSFVDRFRYNAKRASLVQSRLKMLQKMNVPPAVIEDPTFAFSFPAAEPLAGGVPMVRMTEVSFGYFGASGRAGSSHGNQLLFKKLTLALDADSRVAIVGANGAGKSTLLKLCSGELEATAGSLIRAPRARVVKFSQHHVDQLPLNLTPVEFMSSKFPGKDSQEYRSALGNYGITGDLGLQKINTLSGGQKSRVVFAYIGMMKPHLILLDEPTNHLDVETVDVLISALNEFDGGIAVVSHNERLIRAVCNDLWVVENGGTVAPWGDDYDSYKRSIEESLDA